MAARVSALAVFYCLALVGLIVSLAGAAAVERQANTTTTHPERICFPARSWDGDGDRRPCFTVAGPNEDGSARIYLGVRAHYWRACTIPSTPELARTEIVRCTETVRDD